jgi:hypothetical protein
MRKITIDSVAVGDADHGVRFLAANRRLRLGGC